MLMKIKGKCLVLPGQKWELNGVHTWKTCRYPSRSPSRRGLHQRLRHSGHLQEGTTTNQDEVSDMTS